MPAIELDAALVHMNRADEHGNAQCTGPDPYFDHVFAAAAKETFVSVEQVVPTSELTNGYHPSTIAIKRMHVTGVVEAPGGAAFTSCEPDYGVDFEAQQHYASSAASPEAWEAYLREITSKEQSE